MVRLLLLGIKRMCYTVQVDRQAFMICRAMRKVGFMQLIRRRVFKEKARVYVETTGGQIKDRK